jgi:glycerol-3-phosphate dehydrogenase
MDRRAGPGGMLSVAGGKWTTFRHIGKVVLDALTELPGYPAGPDIWAQVIHARDREWAVTVDDVTRRRTTLTVRGLDTPQIRDRIQLMLG